MGEHRGRNIKVGAFALVAIALFLAVVFFLSKSESLFSGKTTLIAVFENTSGLLVGSPVRLAGIDVGTVEDIRFPEDPADKGVIVVLGVDDTFMPRIRKDSFAQMNTKGLLGDMVINISLGDPAAPQLEDGDHITSKEMQGLAQIVASVEGVVSTVRGLTSVVDERVRMVLTEELARDIGRIAHSSANIVEQMERGPGLAHGLLYDPKMAESARGLLADARRTAGRVDRAMGSVEHMLAEVERGDGLLHGAIYGEGGTRVFTELSSAGVELAQILREVREGDGIAHSLIYEDDRTNLIENLAEASRIVKELAQEVGEGKGTIGGLIRDPSVYRDLKHVLGEVRRNILLKALVRMTIDEDDLERPPEVAEGPQGAQDTP